MKKIIFNDSQELIHVQSVSITEGALTVNVINNPYEGLKTIFTDTIATKKMEIDGGTYENYTVFESKKENAGGVFIVKLQQEGKDTETLLQEVTASATKALERVEETNIDLQMAIAELTILVATLSVPVVPEGGIKNV